MSHIYVNLVNDDSDEEGSASEGDYRSEESDGQRVAVAPFVPIVIAPTTTPKKRGRKSLKEVTEARLSALYHGASTIENTGSNGAPGSFDGALTTPMLTPKKRGRPRKAESEKNNRAKSLLRINIGPKAKTRKIEASSPNEESPFPLVQGAVKTDSVKKTRGRPRIHPPKDPSVKRPRGRPRINPLDGEQAYKSQYMKMKRECAKKDALIERLTQYLADLGHSVADILQQADNNSQSNDESEEKVEANESTEEVIQTIEANNIEHSNQKYIGMFVEDNEDNEDKDKDEDSD